MKSEHLELKMLSASFLNQLHRAFELSFEGYQVRVANDLEALKYRLNKVGADLNLSPAIWYKDEVLAFLIQAVGNYSGVKTAYNAGTGVLPAYRGKGMAKDLYHFAIEKNKSIGIEQCLLEVIDTNTPAIKVYKKLGFKSTRLFECYLGKIDKNLKGNKDIQLLPIKDREPNWALYQSFFDFEPCWQNSFDSVIRNFENELIIEAVYKTKTVGFVIFEPLKSKVTQLAVHPAHRRMGIGLQLLRAASKMSVKKELAVINIDAQAKTMNLFLQKCGMTNKITQREMVKPLF